MLEIVHIKDYTGGTKKGIDYYHSKWGDDFNYDFFNDAIRNSSNKQFGLPRFYLLLKIDRIIGCCALVTNDFISRHDLYPWLAGIFIEKTERGKEYGNRLMQYAEKEAKKIGYDKLFLTTSHNSYYEKYGWKRIEDGYELSGDSTRIYMKVL
jgi:N-acetylglutamate synthase-like GNAT family acetyltransferase